MDYPLVNLVEWARRTGGDLAKRQQSTGASDGSTRYVIRDDGSITVLRVDVAFATLTENEWSLDGNIITFTSAPDATDNIFVSYSITRFSDAEVLQFLIDAARGVSGDMLYEWTIDSTNVEDPKIVDVPEALAAGRGRSRIEQLIVLRAAAILYAAKTNQAADDAIKIRDDDTSIDTSVTASASEKALARMGKIYTNAVRTARSEGFVGTAFTEEG